MRNLFTLFLTVMVLSLVASCNKEDAIGSGGSQGEGDGNVQLRIVDSNAGTKAYTGTEQAVTGEIELADQLSLFVFADPGGLEYVNQGITVDPVTRLSNIFKLNDGWKYFYLFSNADIKQIPATGTGYEELEKQQIRVTFENSRPITIAKEGAMTIGTLWRANDGGLFDNRKDIHGQYIGIPQTIGLNIGRAAAKVRLASVTKQTGTANPSPLLGDFSDPSYILRSVANEYFLVGQLDNSGNYPPTTGLRYISAVHEQGPGTNAVPSHYYVDYLWADAKVPSNSDHFYAVENTTKKMTSQNVNVENLFYGNTTYVQLKITYAPGDGEVYDTASPNTVLPGTLAAGTTFYSAIYNGERRIFNAPLPDDPATFGDPQAYENGVMYYHFPIRDPNETGTELQCCVIRNHFYELNVRNILALGKGTPEVDKEEIIDDEDSEVEIEVNVLPWFKVDQDVDLK